MIYLVGALVLWVRTGMGLSDVVQAGVTPFIVPDLAKAVIAAGLATGGRRLLLRQK
jgi:biotin transporter BioY